METQPSNGNGNYLRIVKAIYPFKGSNNDELCFKKDDLIILTQTPEGGWFEGTHLSNRVTGWFPAGYVTPLEPNAIHQLLDNQFILNFNKDSNLQANRKSVIKEIVDGEENHAKDLYSSLHNYVLTLQKSSILQSSEEMENIAKYYCDILAVHQKLHASLKQERAKAAAGRDAMIGGIFMSHARDMKDAHINYCSLHPKFIHSIESRKEEVYNVLTKAEAPINRELTQLITGLSLTFRHLDKYLAWLQELQRYTDDAHPDRGDIQRASFVYRELVSTCLQVRRQAEMEVEVMLGNVKNWPADEPISSLGKLDHMGPVTILGSKDASNPCQREIKKDRYLVLFPAHLIILAVSNEMTSFLFEDKLALMDVTLPRLPEIQSTKTTFELLFTDPQSEHTGRFHFLCNNPEDVRKWISCMHKCKSKLEPVKPTTHSVVVTPAGTTTGTTSSSDRSLVRDHIKASHPSISSDGSSPSLLSTTDNNRSKYWAAKSLLPHPPIRRPLSGADDAASRLDSIESNKDDMLILGVIEAYCRNDKKNQSVGPPQVTLHEDYADTGTINRSVSASASGLVGGNTLMNSSMITPPFKKSTTSLSTHEEIENLRNQINTLAKALKAEVKIRKKLQSVIDELASAK